jgi:hypothetical protein
MAALYGCDGVPGLLCTLDSSGILPLALLCLTKASKYLSKSIIPNAVLILAFINYNTSSLGRSEFFLLRLI